MSHHRSHLLSATVALCLAWGTAHLLAQDIGGGFAMRFTSNGSSDATFDPPGVLAYDLALAAAVDGQNRIIVAGTRDDKFVVTRLLASGSVDTDFGINGVAEKAFTEAAEARAVAIAPSGRIFVAGRSGDDFAVACFSDYGGNCTWFGADSKVTTTFPGVAEANAITIGSDGKIVVGGRARSSTASTILEMCALARYDTFGMLDPSFGSGGRVTCDLGTAAWPATNHESVSGLAIDSSGRILAAGAFSAQSVSPRFALLRFRADGWPDTTFGPNSNGMVTAFGGCNGPCYEEAFGTSIALQPDGRIVVAGGARLLGSGSLDYDVALARFLPDGSLDASGFGYKGYVRTSLGNYEEARAVKVAGASLYVAGHSGGQAMVARYSVSNGSLVSEFDGGVVVTTPSCSGPAFALVVQSFPCRGGFCAPIRKPVIVGTCVSF